MNKIDEISIQGFKSIRSLDKLQLNNLNVLIGANGAGKSNFVSYFRMLHELVEGRLQVWTSKQGGADRVLSYGVKETQKLHTTIRFGVNGYSADLEPTTGDNFTFSSERLYFDGPFFGVTEPNLAAYLFKLQCENSEVYAQICKTVRLAVPFFDDFVLKPIQLASGEEQIRLLWKQADSDYPLWPSQLSDGSIRFICLVTTLLQPNPPSTIIIDEPELGLHPYAITLLGALLRSASKRMQVIVSTQSVPLLNEFELDDLIVVEREEGASTFKRLDADKFCTWLDNYSVGELWEKNIIGGRP
ncbi:TPA: ATP-binding cassette domain-containing protein [Vibrio vulnificus]|nr:ATP-binding cassette domain-containing protein [Vibrio vulnificus]